MTCTRCGSLLDATMTACATCGAEVPPDRLLALLGRVCRACDTWNEPASRSCAGCGHALGDAADPLAPPPEPEGEPEAEAEAVVEYVEGEDVTAVDVLELLDPRTARPAAARLVVERGAAPAGTTYPIYDDELAAGRAQATLAFPDDPCLAPLHATFTVREGTVRVRDEGAAGGVYVRVRAASAPLRTGALFAIGDRLLRYGGVLAPPAPPSAEGTWRLGAPRPDRPAIVLEEWLEGGVGGRTWIRPGPAVTLGRSGCAVDLGDDRLVAKVHAEIALDATGAAQLRDLGSPDGIFVRLAPGSERALRDGDAVRLGREVLRVEAGQG